jgi:hypothetical protein
MGRLPLDEMGFPVPTAKDYLNLTLRVTEEGETVVTPVGTYLLWTPSKGIELRVKVVSEDELTFVHAHFMGEARMHVAIVDKKRYEKTALAEGGFIAYPNPVKGQGFLTEHVNLQYGDGTYSGHIPLLFDTPDFDKYAELEPPFLADIQLTAFPFLLRSFETEDDWIDWQIDSGIEEPDENGDYGYFTGMTFLPDAVGHQRKHKDDYPKSTAFIAGTILENAILTNDATGKDFCWAKVITKLGEVDIVAAPDILDGPIVQNGILSCHCSLSGRIVRIPEFNFSLE